jgi:thiol-disulfide isomerase/thioredoxin
LQYSDLAGHGGIEVMTSGEGHLEGQGELPATAPPRRLWRWLLVAVGVALLLGLWLAGRDDEADGNGTRHPAVGHALTALELVPLVGTSQTISLADLDGKVAVINLWGPWCGYCLLEFPELVELEAHYRQRPEFMFLSVASNPDPWDTTGLATSVQEVLRRHRAEFPVYRDPGGQVARQLIAAAGGNFPLGFPTTVLVGPDRTIRGLWVGYRNGDIRRLRLAIEAELRRRSSTSS